MVRETESFLEQGDKQRIITRAEIAEIIARYRKNLRERDVPIHYLPLGEIPSNNIDKLAHCRGMLDKMEVFLREGRVEKIFRWIGFITGCLCSADGFKTTEDLKQSFISWHYMEKAFVWLGFIQGCFWWSGIYSREDLMNHSRP